MRALVSKYGAGLECVTIERVEGGGSRPAARLAFADTAYGAVENVAIRLHGMFWKGRGLFAQTVAAERDIDS